MIPFDLDLNSVLAWARSVLGLFLPALALVAGVWLGAYIVRRFVSALGPSVDDDDLDADFDVDDLDDFDDLDFEED